MIHYEETGLPATRFTAAVGGCRLVEIGGSAHMPNMERPAEFNAALQSFLDQ